MSKSRKNIKVEHIKWFNAVYKEYLKNNKGFANPLEYIEWIYGGSKAYWAVIARAAGFEAMQRNGIYYFGVKQANEIKEEGKE
jgi:hypothetical protein